MNHIITKTTKNIITVAMLAFLLISNAKVVYAANGGSTGDNSNQSSCSHSSNSWINNKCKTTGAHYWIKYPVSSDDVWASDLGQGSVLGIRAYHWASGAYHNEDSGGDAHITGCASDGGAVYINGTVSNGKDGILGQYEHWTAGRTSGMTLWNSAAEAPYNFIGSAGNYIVPEQEVRDLYENGYDLDDGKPVKEVLRAQGVSDWSQLTWLCSFSNGKETPPPTGDGVDVCKEANDYYKSANLGSTAGRVSVANLTNTHGWSDGNDTNKSASTGFNVTSDSVSIFAKPGDSIRFRHNLCYGARAIRDSNGAHVDVGGNNHAPSIPANSFSITASPRDAYLFRDSMGQSKKLFGSNISITDMTSRPSQVSAYAESNSVVVGDYGFAAYSPGGSSNKIKDNYSCSYFNSSANGPKYQANGYQIPGFKAGVTDCKSRTKTENNNAGKVISQTLSFDNIKAWQKYTTNAGGTCNCGTGNAYESTTTHWSFESAKGASPLVWALYHFPACNNKGFVCNSYCEDEKKDKYGNVIGCNHAMPKYHSYLYEQPDAGTNTGIYGPTRKAYYEVLSTNAGRVTKTASVYIPYNFNTEVKVTSPTSGTTVYQGEPITTSFSWKVTKRSNPAISSAAYATTMPSNAKYQIVEFITNTTPNDGRLAANDNISISSPYDYYKQIAYGGRISQIKVGSDHTNETGNYNGDSYAHTNNGIIPDNEDLVGYKYCVAIGIYPASSHAKGDNNNKGGAAFSENGNDKWNISGATCRTIAKKPSFQVWGGSIYTGGSVDTAVARKIAGAKLGDKSDGKNKTMYGSWVEYAALVGQNVNGLGTGASLGYNLNTYAFNYRGGHSNTTNMLDLSHMTVQNMKTSPGNSKINATTPNNAWLAQLYARYRDAAKKYGDGGNTDGGYHIYTMDSGMEVLHVKTNGTYNLSQLIGLNPGDGGKKNTDTLRISGKTVAKGSASNFDTDNTLVIYIENGTINIDKNICYSNSTAECDFTAGPKDNSNLALQLNTSSLSVDALEKLPQVLIFAKNITVASHVNRIDAWLIADGNINTCSAGHGNSVTCDTALVVNGPLYAKTVNFNRTAGAHGSVDNCTAANCDNNNPQNRNIGGVDDGSIAPAEVFNLRADVYLWAQNQAARYVQATSTFTRELAPRY